VVRSYINLSVVVSSLLECRIIVYTRKNVELLYIPQKIRIIASIAVVPGFRKYYFILFKNSKNLILYIPQLLYMPQLLYLPQLIV
jgi:hypothetical protein